MSVLVGLFSTQVSGQVRRSTDRAPVPDLVVEVQIFDVTTQSWMRHSSKPTDPQGRFSLTIHAIPLLFANLARYRARVLTPVGRVLHTSPEKSAFNALKLDVLLHPKQAKGWLVTIGSATGATPLLSHRNAVRLLADNEVAWRAVKDSIAKASTHINMLLFLWDIEATYLTLPANEPSGAAKAAAALKQGTLLKDAVLARASAGGGIPVRVCMRHHEPPFNRASTAEVVEAFFRKTPGHRVTVRRATTAVPTPMHAKVVTTDGREALLVASPFLQEFWDTKAHSVEEWRRGQMRNHYHYKYGPNSGMNEIQKPVHDVSASVIGESVDAIDETIHRQWNKGGAAEAPTSKATHASSPLTTVQVTRTLQEGFDATSPHGEIGVFESYLRVFELAQDYIYLENQYLTYSPIFDAIRTALKRQKQLEIIVLTNIRLDIPGYQVRQVARIKSLLAQAKADKTDGRLGVFTLWTLEPSAKWRVINNYVHSKFACADDKWMTVGSANLDGASLERSLWNRILSTAPAGMIAGRERSLELNVAVYNNVDGARPSALPRDGRVELWAEHLTAKPSTLRARPAKGWLSLWKDAAKRCLDTLKNPTLVPQLEDAKPRVLPWAPHDQAKPYLQSLGVDVTGIEVLDKVPSFDFKKGLWEA